MTISVQARGRSQISVIPNLNAVLFLIPILGRRSADAADVLAVSRQMQPPNVVTPGRFQQNIRTAVTQVEEPNRSFDATKKQTISRLVELDVISEVDVIPLFRGFERGFQRH